MDNIKVIRAKKYNYIKKIKAELVVAFEIVNMDPIHFYI